MNRRVISTNTATPWTTGAAERRPSRTIDPSGATLSARTPHIGRTARRSGAAATRFPSIAAHAGHVVDGKRHRAGAGRARGRLGARTGPGQARPWLRQRFVELALGFFLVDADGEGELRHEDLL